MAAPSTTEAGPQKRLVDILREAVEAKNDGEERQLDLAGGVLSLVTKQAGRGRAAQGRGGKGKSDRPSLTPPGAA